MREIQYTQNQYTKYTRFDISMNDNNNTRMGITNMTISQ